MNAVNMRVAVNDGVMLAAKKNEITGLVSLFVRHFGTATRALALFGDNVRDLADYCSAGTRVMIHKATSAIWECADSS